jgi:DNA-binding GntR family transcriptional regulator
VTETDRDALYAPSLVEMTSRRLRAEILSGELAPGQRLVEEQIRQRFAISRAPLREALRLLANEGLVEHLPRRGARVTELSDTDIDELFGLRALLERYAVSQAFPLAMAPTGGGAGAADPLADVRAQLAEMKRADADGDDLAKDDAHRAFHAAIVALAGNHQLDLAIEPILLQLQRPMAANLRRETALLGAGAGIQRHERLLCALESNDLPTVLAAMDQHGTRRYLPGAAIPA